MNNGSKPAYPQYVKSHGPDVVEQITDGGLTKREYFAAMAMQGLISAAGDQTGKVSFDDVAVARNAISVADELLKQLEP